MPPYVAEGVQFFGFAVKADKAKLQAICDRYLNGPCGRQDFVPLVGRVLFVLNRIARMYAKNPPDDNRGWYSEQEGAVWMPVYDSKRGRLLWYHPYMIVDSSYALCMGREIYGFPKEFGWFDISNGPNPPQATHVDTVMVKELVAGCEAKQACFFEAKIAGGPSTSSPPYQTMASYKQLAETLVERLEVAPNAAPVLASAQLSNLLSMPIPMVFLKQFRDGVSPDRVCFQSIQEATTRMTRFHSACVYLQRYEILIEDFASHPVRQELGLTPGPIPVDLAFWALFDFEIGSCTEVWRAPA
jgi:hypothetical protein